MATQEHQAETRSGYDGAKEVKKFDQSRLGVKGLVDSGVAKIPRFFVHPPENRPKASDPHKTELQVPVIDLGEINGGRRKEIIQEIRQASETWGFFQVVNLEIPTNVLNEMLDGLRGFHEQPREVKMELYSRDFHKKVKFNTNYDLFQSRAATWRDTFYCICEVLDAQEIPSVCREITISYSEHVLNLGKTLCELLSEALGLDPGYLNKLQCSQGLVLAGHYYPACPEPELTLGATSHTDPDFLTILLQDHIGGLQVLYQQQWVDVNPIPGAVIVNIGDLLQLITNNKFKSVAHRVLASHIGPRISVAGFFNGNTEGRTYGPIKELLSNDNPPVYREIVTGDFIKYFLSTSSGTNCLEQCKL